jgi:hypothetical protein
VSANVSQTNMTMQRVAIDEVAIDSAGRLLVRPAAPATFEFIYRAAAGVGWSPASRSLSSPAPDKWTHFEWFTHMHGAVKSEYGQLLVISPSTRWSNVPMPVQAQIVEWLSEVEPESRD